MSIAAEFGIEAQSTSQKADSLRLKPLCGSDHLHLEGDMCEENSILCRTSINAGKDAIDFTPTPDRQLIRLSTASHSSAAC